MPCLSFRMLGRTSPAQSPISSPCEAAGLGTSGISNPLDSVPVVEGGRSGLVVPRGWLEMVGFLSVSSSRNLCNFF